MFGLLRLIGLITAGLAVTTVSTTAQQQAAVCGENELPRGDIGYSGFECNCDLSVFKEERPEGHFLYRFRSEPVIRGVEPGEWIATTAVHFLREGQQVRLQSNGPEERPS